MSDTCGPSCSPPFARYDPDSSSWRTSAATSLWDLTLSSLTLPPWGCLHGGELSEHLTPELRTVAPVSSSSLLPTVTTQDAENMAGPSQLRRHTWPLNTVAPMLTMLPTPAVMRGGSSTEMAGLLLPTPRESEAQHSGRVATTHDGQTGLAEVANSLSIGASTDPRSTDGSESSDETLLRLPFPEPLDETA